MLAVCLNFASASRQRCGRKTPKIRFPMSCILHIETSTRVCSVALSQDGSCIFDKENPDGPNHASVLAPYVDEAVSFADSHAIPIDAVAVSQGPGSYTGLRIGVSTAKGVCFGRRLKLLAVPTLQVLCTPVLLFHELEDDALLCPMIDARRMEVYAALYDRALTEICPVSAVVVDGDTWHEQLDRRPVYFFGDGAAKCREAIRHPNAHFIDGIRPLARHMMPLAERALARDEVQDVAYFEPFYLKEFVASRPKALL